MMSLRPGYNFNNKGTYIKNFCIVVLIVFTICYLIYLLLKFLNRKNPNVKIYFAVFIVVLIVLIHLKIVKSRRDFELGFNNEWLDNKHFNIPAKCKL